MVPQWIFFWLKVGEPFTKPNYHFSSLEKLDLLGGMSGKSGVWHLPCNPGCPKEIRAAGKAAHRCDWVQHLVPLKNIYGKLGMTWGYKYSIDGTQGSQPLTAAWVILMRGCQIEICCNYLFTHCKLHIKTMTILGIFIPFRFDLFHPNLPCGPVHREQVGV